MGGRLRKASACWIRPPTPGTFPEGTWSVWGVYQSPHVRFLGFQRLEGGGVFYILPQTLWAIWPSLGQLCRAA